MKTTGERLAHLRIQRGLSQAQVADIIGVDRTSYAKYEKNVNKPTRKLRELSDLFNVSSDYIMCLSDHPSQERGPTPTYYHSPEVAEIADRLKNQPGMHMLFDASRNMTKQDIEAVVGLIKQFKGGD